MTLPLKREPTQEAIAGFSALAYQIVSFKIILMSGLGDALSVAISLTAFVTLSGLGALLAGKLSGRSCGWIEGALGVYALTVFGALATGDIGMMIARLGEFSLYAKLAILLVGLSPFAILSGMLIPLYEHGRNTRAHEIGASSAFIPVFIAFHAGGALALIALETMIFPVWGWVAAGIALAIVSVGNALVLSWYNQKDPSDESVGASGEDKTEATFHNKWYWLLFVLSVATGIAGISVYKAFDYLVGPNIRNYTVVTAFIFMGLSVAGVLANRFIAQFSSIVGATALGLAWMTGISFLLSDVIVAVIDVSGSSWAAYYLTAALLIIPMFALIGISVPGAVKLGAKGSVTLFVVSIGNAVGYWAYILLAPFLIDLWVLAAVVGLFSLAVAHRTPAMTVAAIGLGVVMPAMSDYSAIHHVILDQNIRNASSAQAGMYPGEATAPSKLTHETELYGSWNTYGWSTDHMALHSYQNETLIKTQDYLYIGGMQSLKIFDSEEAKYTYWQHGTEIAESLSALLPAIFVKNKERSLVLGVGTGISASAVDSVFENTEIVDISPDALAHLVHFSLSNDRVYKRALLHQADALTIISDNSGKDDKFDYVFNTLTGPGYSFSTWMYSKQSMEMIKNSLTENGVYAFWLDSRTQSEAMKVLMAAAQETFGNVQSLRVQAPPAFGNVEVKRKAKEWNDTYQLVIASNKPLKIQEKTAVPIIEKLVAAGLSTWDHSEITARSIIEDREMMMPDIEPGAYRKADITVMSYAYEYALEIDKFNFWLNDYKDAGKRMEQ